MLDRVAVDRTKIDRNSKHWFLWFRYQLRFECSDGEWVEFRFSCFYQYSIKANRNLLLILIVVSKKNAPHIASEVMYMRDVSTLANRRDEKDVQNLATLFVISCQSLNWALAKITFLDAPSSFFLNPTSNSCI